MLQILCVSDSIKRPHTEKVFTDEDNCNHSNRDGRLQKENVIGNGAGDAEVTLEDDDELLW